MNRARAALVTGDRGFVGRHMRARLEADGWAVMGLDVKRDAHEDVRLFFRDDRTHFDLVVHCAAVVGGRQMIEGQPLALAVDLAIDADLFGWALRTRPGRVVYYSSSAAYPVALQGPGACGWLTESMIDLRRPGAPDLTYGWSKLTGEVLAGHARAAGIPVTVLRPFSGYGPDQDLDYPFPAFIRRAIDGADPFDVWGPGTQVRDFVHIDDVVGATMAAIELGVNAPVNICTGRGTSFLELAELVSDVAGYAPLISTHPDRPTGVLTRVGDPFALRRFYQPKISLEQGVAEALAIGTAA